MVSYLVQLESLHGTAASRAPEYVDAFITFDQPIPGLSTAPDTLNSSDVLTGYDIETYLGSIGGTKRGLETGELAEIRQDGKTLDLRMRLGERSTLAQVRVFVRTE